MSTTKMRKVTGALAATLGAVAFLLPSLTWDASADQPEYAQACLRGVRTEGTGFSYEVQTTGKHKKLVVTGGSFQGSFSIAAPSCPGATYAIRVESNDGTPLNWLTTSTTPAGAVTTVSPDGTVATISFAGDGMATNFAVQGSTAQYTDRCVQSAASIALAGTIVNSSVLQPACASADRGSGGGNYF
jgi:hypothetical protein